MNEGMPRTGSEEAGITEEGTVAVLSLRLCKIEYLSILSVRNEGMLRTAVEDCCAVTSGASELVRV